MSACVCSFDVHSAYNIFTKKNCSTPRNINYTKKKRKEVVISIQIDRYYGKVKKAYCKAFHRFECLSCSSFIILPTEGGTASLFFGQYMVIGISFENN